LETEGQDIKVLNFPIVLSAGKQKVSMPEVSEIAKKKRVTKIKE
jgi:hypothetical protein